MALDKLTKVQSVGISSFIRVVGVVTATQGFDGNITGIITATGDLTFGANSKAKLFENGTQSGVQATNSGSSAHLMTHDGNEDIHVDPSGYIKVEVAGSERLRITSTGQQQSHAGYAGVGINTFASWARTGGAIRAEVGYNAVTTDYMYFGTGTNHPLALRVNNSNALYIKNDANRSVGIGTDNPDGLLTIKGNSDEVSTPSIRLLDGTDTREVSITNTSGDFVVSTHGTDDAIHGRIKIFESGIIDLDTGGASGTVTNRLRIDSDGAVFFKGTSDGTKGTINLESQDPFIRLYDTNGTADRRKWDIRLIGAGGFEELDFRTINDANNSFISRMQIEYGGDVNISDGNLRVANGHGVDFSATSDASGSTSELLDDYEEGIWTPTIRLDGGTANGTTLAPLSTYKGRYVKIGDMVFVEAYVRYNFSSLSGTWTTTTIQGLPYTQGNQNSQQYTAVHIGYLSGFYTGFPTTNNNFPGGYVRSGQSDLALTINNPNGGETTISNSVLSSNANAGIMFSAYYRDSASG